MTNENVQQLAKCVKQLQDMQKKIDKILSEIKKRENALFAASCTIDEAIEYLNTSLEIY